MTRLTRIDLASAAPDSLDRLLRRSAVPDRRVRDGALVICDDVAERGDVAVSEYAERFGGGFQRIDRATLERAADEVEPEVLAALRDAADRIATFHRAQLPGELQVQTAEGVELTRRWQPMTRA